MRKFFIISLLLLSINLLQATNPAINQVLAEKSNLYPAAKTGCDTLVNVDGYNVHIICEDGLVSQIGLNLFSDDMKNSMDRSLLEFIETALLAKILNEDKGSFENLKIAEGTLSDFKGIDYQSPYTLTAVDSKDWALEWDLGNKKIVLSLPIGYDIIQEGSRGEIENEFIKKLQAKKNTERKSFRNYSHEELKRYGEDLYFLPGDTYISKDINRNTIFEKEDSISFKPVWNISHPVESIGNMMIYPSSIYSNPILDVTILKHEYGETENIEITLNKFIAICENEGCIPFWGVENFDGEKLQGALFLYNPFQGYDHVLKIECKPEEIINGTGKIKGRASLYIPTNNVHNLFSPYVPKTEDEKIKYDK